jgi:glycosyltransferase involved in cell wall biosynthesis
MSPVVSIVIPVRNREKLIRYSIDSIRKQTFTDWECIVVDDGSSDETVKVVEIISRQDRRVKVVNRGDYSSACGACACRNLGTKLASGHWLCYLDSDDALGDRCLEERIECVRASDDGLDFAIFPCLLFRNEIGDSAERWNWPSKEDVLLRFLKLDVPWQTSSPLWKREFVLQFKWRDDLPSMQDWDFHLRVLMTRPRFREFVCGYCYWRLPAHRTIGLDAGHRLHLIRTAEAINDLWMIYAVTGLNDQQVHAAFAGLVFDRTVKMIDRGLGAEAFRFSLRVMQSKPMRFDKLPPIFLSLAAKLPKGRGALQKFFKRCLSPSMFPSFPPHFRSSSPPEVFDKLNCQQ